MAQIEITGRMTGVVSAYPHATLERLAVDAAAAGERAVFLRGDGLAKIAGELLEARALLREIVRKQEERRASGEFVLVPRFMVEAAEEIIERSEWGAD